MKVRVAVVLAMLGVSWLPCSAAWAAAGGCRGGNPMANVYAPSRLKVLSRCRTVSGTIVSSQREADGDFHLYLRVDPKYASMLNAGNRANHGNTLVLEIVPADQAGCIKGHKVKDGICSGVHLATPKNGRHVTVTGPWVYDRNHGWNEIHPVWQIS